MDVLFMNLFDLCEKRGVGLRSSGERWPSGIIPYVIKESIGEYYYQYYLFDVLVILWVFSPRSCITDRKCDEENRGPHKSEWNFNSTISP